MSVLQDLAARLRAGAEQLPADTVLAAADRLTVASELLSWVRRTSPHPMGVPQLAGAVEHLEHASSALRGAQDAIEAYLASIGVSSLPVKDSTGELTRRAVVDDEPLSPATDTPHPQPLHRWWVDRVDKLVDPDGQPRAPVPEGRPTGPIDPIDLLRTIAQRVRDDDRSQLHEDLRRVAPPVGLGLSAVSPSALRKLATDYLGGTPRPENLDRLRDATGGRLRTLLPGLAPSVSATLLERLCHVPQDQRDRERRRRLELQREREQRETAKREREAASDQRKEAAWNEAVDHPTDLAVANAVLVGILLQRLGRQPDAVTRDLTSGSKPGPERANA